MGVESVHGRIKFRTQETHTEVESVHGGVKFCAQIINPYGGEGAYDDMTFPSRRCQFYSRRRRSVFFRRLLRRGVVVTPGEKERRLFSRHEYIRSRARRYAGGK